MWVRAVLIRWGRILFAERIDVLSQVADGFGVGGRQENFGVGVLFEPFAEVHDGGFGGGGDGVAEAGSADGFEFAVAAGVPQRIGVSVVEQEGPKHGVA